MRSRFQQELSGELGDYWEQRAKAELEKIKADLASGEIVIDEAGVARNCIGRALMDDLLEKVFLAGGKVDVAATQAARSAENEKEMKACRRSKRPPSAEERAEMRAVFGEGATVVDVLTGEEIKL